MKDIQYSKLVITFFAHLFVAVLYGSFFSVMLKEYGFPQWFCVTVQVGTIVLVTYVAYREEVRRHYPFLKALGVNFLGFVLWLAVAMTKLYLLEFVALAVVLWAIRYPCRRCVEYKRFTIG